MVRLQYVWVCRDAHPGRVPCHLQANLAYVGLHNELDALLRVRAGPVGGSDVEAKGVSVVYFSGSHAVMLQNFVYTAVK